MRINKDELKTGDIFEVPVSKYERKMGWKQLRYKVEGFLKYDGERHIRAIRVRKDGTTFGRVNFIYIRDQVVLIQKKERR